ncbi:hypothetical protein ACIQ2D_15370 [Lysinibacillus sp. NPDC097287]|uniref:hypothetical protein n=1 Tax=Lysinibacillus sp. NPDC097287 TaxID=3364144 RepID=UPI0038152661
MKKQDLVSKIVRIIFGVMMVGSGIGMIILGGFPIEYENVSANQFMIAMVDTGYFVLFLALVKIVCGIAFITNRFLPLALVIFMPVSINMVMFHIFLEPVTGVGAYMILAMNVFLMVKNIESYRPLLKMR